MLDVRRLRTLRELADRGTIAAAADALHLTPSAVSQQLAALETALGQPLLERTPRSVRLTPAAHVVLRHADAMLVETERLEADLHALAAGRGGRVRIGAFSTAISGLVAPALASAAVHAARLDVEVVELESPESFERLARHELDVVVSMESEHAPPSGDPRTTRVPLLADRLDAALPTAHPLAADAAIPLAALATDPWIAPPLGWSCEHVVTAACSAAGFRPDVRHRASDWAAVLALVGCGMGVSLVPRLARLAAPPGVVLRPLDGETPARHLFAACRRGAERHPAVATVLGALVAVATDAASEPERVVALAS